MNNNIEVKNEKENLEGYVTRQELSEAKLQIKADVMKEVAQLFGNAAMNTQQVVTPALMQQMMQMINEPGMNISPTIYVNHMYEDSFIINLLQSVNVNDIMLSDIGIDEIVKKAYSREV